MTAGSGLATGLARRRRLTWQRRGGFPSPGRKARETGLRRTSAPTLERPCRRRTKLMTRRCRDFRQRCGQPASAYLRALVEGQSGWRRFSRRTAVQQSPLGISVEDCTPQPAVNRQLADPPKVCWGRWATLPLTQEEEPTRRSRLDHDAEVFYWSTTIGRSARHIESRRGTRWDITNLRTLEHGVKEGLRLHAGLMLPRCRPLVDSSVVRPVHQPYSGHLPHRLPLAPASSPFIAAPMAAVADSL